MHLECAPEPPTHSWPPFRGLLELYCGKRNSARAASGNFRRVMATVLSRGAVSAASAWWVQRQARPDIPAVEEDSFALDDLRQSPVRFDAQGHERKAFGRADIGGAEAQRLYHERLATDISPANAGVLSVVTPDGDHYVEDLPACQRAELAMSLSGGTVTLERGRHVAGRNKYGAETAKKD